MGMQTMDRALVQLGFRALTTAVLCQVDDRPSAGSKSSNPSPAARYAGPSRAPSVAQKPVSAMPSGPVTRAWSRSCSGRPATRVSSTESTSVLRW